MKTDVEIITILIDALKLNPRSFSKELGYASPSTIYNITKGTNRLSDDLKNRIRLRFPEVSRIYLDKGEGNPILTGPQFTNQQNIENIFPKQDTPKITSLEDLLGLPHQIGNMSLMTKRNYETLESLVLEVQEVKKLLESFRIKKP